MVRVGMDKAMLFEAMALKGVILTMWASFREFLKKKRSANSAAEPSVCPEDVA